MSLQVEHLNLFLVSDPQPIQILHDISFSIQPGETIGIVGESGCGKSMTSLAIMQLIPQPPLQKMEGSIRWKDQNLLDLSQRQMRKIRGNEIAMIFQEPMTALNPVIRVGDQIREILREHEKMSASEEKQRIVELLTQVGIPSPEHRAKEFPHELSGGMRQRVMIAMALACNPLLLIADEPTTALDVTIQAQILELLKQLRDSYQMGLLFISHDLDVVGYLADRVLVMYAGEVVETAPAQLLFDNPAHPYTQALQNSRPKQKGESLQPIPGNVPPLDSLPVGCRFYERCSKRKPQCAQQHPPSFVVEAGHTVRCFLYEN